MLASFSCKQSGEQDIGSIGLLIQAFYVELQISRHNGQHISIKQQGK